MNRRFEGTSITAPGSNSGEDARRLQQSSAWRARPHDRKASWEMSEEYAGVRSNQTCRRRRHDLRRLMAEEDLGVRSDKSRRSRVGVRTLTYSGSFSASKPPTGGHSLFHLFLKFTRRTALEACLPARMSRSACRTKGPGPVLTCETNRTSRRRSASELLDETPSRGRNQRRRTGGVGLITRTILGPVPRTRSIACSRICSRTIRYPGVQDGTNWHFRRTYCA